MSFMNRGLSHKQDRLEQNDSNVKSLSMFNKIEELPYPFRI